MEAFRGEIKRNPDKVILPALQEKAQSILQHHKGWDTRFVGLSLKDM